MEKELVLTIDCGTQGIRAIVFDKTGRALAKTEKRFEGYYSKKPHYVEGRGAAGFHQLDGPADAGKTVDDSAALPFRLLDSGQKSLY